MHQPQNEQKMIIAIYIYWEKHVVGKVDGINPNQNQKTHLPNRDYELKVEA